MAESVLFNEISNLETEQRNPATANIDLSGIRETLEMLNAEDSLVAPAVGAVIDDIAPAVESIVKAFRCGGRLFYFGAGTSGRLGVVDASECPPTFGTPPDMVQGVIAGGREAMFVAQEGAEDSVESAKQVARNLGICEKDIICGIAASGRTPFVRGALEFARENGIPSILITTASKAKIAELGMKADFLIAPQVGPEPITGSTRMKSGTAQKLVLNMLTTTAMVQLGKTYGNVMVDLQLTNKKLEERAKKIIMTIADVDYDRAVELLREAHGHVKTALVVALAGVSAEKAADMLHESGGFIRLALKKYYEGK